jgi:hypothetical protein
VLFCLKIVSNKHKDKAAFFKNVKEKFKDKFNVIKYLSLQDDVERINNMLKSGQNIVRE